MPLLCCLASAGMLAMAQSAVSKRQEYHVKALLLKNLGGYVSWPAAANPGKTAFVIGVFGVNPFAGYLDDVVRGQAIHGRRVQVVYFQALTQSAVDGCDVLFICDSEVDRLAETLRVCRGRPVLTLGDHPDMARRGVMLNLLIRDGFVEAEVNLRALRSAGLEISSSFLALGKGRVKVVEGP